VILHCNSDLPGVNNVGRIFISDEKGYKYAQSLVGNVRSDKGDCEFDKVVSLQGVYMANIVVPGTTQSGTGFKEAAEDAAEDAERDTGSQLEKTHGRGGKSMPKPGKEERTIRTVISFDKGGEWDLLSPPKKNSQGQSYECAGKPLSECSLHLHGTTSWDFYAPFYSAENAVGIVMGTGNVGSSLRFEPDEQSTFLSRDGGLTWTEAHKGAYIYEFGDHGGLVVMADDLKKTSLVVFSWNEGEKWFDFTVSNTPFEVDNILTDPNSTATTFVMFGTRQGGEGVLYYLKFDALEFPTCQGVWAADSVSSDYETWSPSDGSKTGSDTCLLGQQVTYTRRKRSVECWNGIEFERPTQVKKCSCTELDFECDMGFSRAIGSKECVYGGPEMFPTRFIPKFCTGMFKTSAYRKVPGDQCEGGFAPALTEIACPKTGGSSDYLKYCLVCVLALGVFYMGNDWVRSSNKNVFSEIGTSGKWSPVPILAGLARGIMALLIPAGRGFDGNFRYKKVDGDEDGLGHEDESLSDFIDEAGQDDFAPRVYDSADEKRYRTPKDEPSTISGGLRSATDAVPKLSGPPGSSGPQHFDLGSADEDLL